MCVCVCVCVCGVTLTQNRYTSVRLIVKPIIR